MGTFQPIKADPKPDLQTTWFSAMVYSVLAAALCAPFLDHLFRLGVYRAADGNIRFYSQADNDVLQAVITGCLAYACLVGRARQSVNWIVGIALVPWLTAIALTMFLVARIGAIFNRENILAAVYLSLLPFPLLSSSVRRSRIALILLAMCVFAAALLVLMTLHRDALRGTADAFSLSLYWVYLPLSVGFVLGRAFRIDSMDTLCKPVSSSTRGLIPKQFSLRSIFALTTAVAILTCALTQFQVSVGWMLRTIAAIAVGDAVAIMVASRFVVPHRDETLGQRHPRCHSPRDTRLDERGG